MTHDLLQRHNTVKLYYCSIG